jgi:hypothetical protein
VAADVADAGVRIVAERGRGFLKGRLLRWGDGHESLFVAEELRALLMPVFGEVRMCSMLGSERVRAFDAERGRQVFFNKAHCSACHAGSDFTDGSFHNIGVGDSGRALVTRKATQTVRSALACMFSMRIRNRWTRHCHRWCYRSLARRPDPACLRLAQEPDLREELVEQCRQRRALGLLGLMLFQFGDYLLAANRLDEARTIGVEGIRLNRSLGRSAPVNACIETVALATALQGLHARAARLAGYVKAFYDNVDFVRDQTQQRTWDRLMATLREPLASGALERLMAEGAVWSEETAVNEATKV